MTRQTMPIMLTLSFQVSHELARKVFEAAAQRNQTHSELLHEALRWHLKRLEQDAAG